jgi:hypothetical protein
MCVTLPARRAGWDHPAWCASWHGRLLQPLSGQPCSQNPIRQLLALLGGSTDRTPASLLLLQLTQALLVTAHPPEFQAPDKPKRVRLPRQRSPHLHWARPFRLRSFSKPTSPVTRQVLAYGRQSGCRLFASVLETADLRQAMLGRVLVPPGMALARAGLTERLADSPVHFDTLLSAPPAEPADPHGLFSPSPGEVPAPSAPHS